MSEDKPDGRPEPKRITLEELQKILDGKSKHGRVERAEITDMVEQQVLEDGTVLRRYTKTSPFSGQVNRMILAAAPEAWAAYDSGQLIQRALPHLTAAEREFLLSGTTSEEWDAAFLEDEDDDDGREA